MATEQFPAFEGITLNSVDLGNPVSLTSVAFDDFAKVTGGKVYSNDFETQFRRRSGPHIRATSSNMTRLAVTANPIRFA